MKIYTVMQGAFTTHDDEDATRFLFGQTAPQVFDDEDSAVTAAQLIARTHRGRQVWVVEGEAKRAFYVEPVPVAEVAPTVSVIE